MRILPWLIVAPAIYLFAYWLSVAFIAWPPTHLTHHAVAAASAFAVSWYVATTPNSLVGCVCTGAFVTGTIGFVGGFFGPLILMPGTNQGPLLGIFITGPLGLLLGGVGGFVHWLSVRRGSRASIPKSALCC